MTISCFTWQMCVDNRDHYKLMGDIANSNRFDQLALYTRKDLDVVRSAASRGETPRWKNEMRTFSIVKYSSAAMMTFR